jgi:hypothetical protein
LTQYGYYSRSSFIYEGKHRNLSKSGGVIQPGEMVTVNHPYNINTLNPYYDLSQPGEYELWNCVKITFT